MTERPRAPGRPRGDLGTRERLLELAIPAFAERGFAGTSVRELATAAGVTNASLLHHYPSKEALYGAVLSRIADSLAVWSEPPPGEGAEDMRALPAPDFDGLPLDRYLSPHLTLPYDPTRGIVVYRG